MTLPQCTRQSLASGVSVAAKGAPLRKLEGPSDPMTDDADRKDQEEESARRDFVNLLAVIVCLVILIAGFWLMNRLWEAKKLQDCVFSGRRNCGAAIETTR